MKHSNTGKPMKYPKGAAANTRPSNPNVKQDGRHSQAKVKRSCGDRHK